MKTSQLGRGVLDDGVDTIPVLQHEVVLQTLVAERRTCLLLKDVKQVLLTIDRERNFRHLMVRVAV